MGAEGKAGNMEDVCEVCGEHRTTVVHRSWGVVRCSNCGLIFSQQRSVPQDLYEKAYTVEGKIATYVFNGQEYKFRVEKMWRKLLQRLARFREPGRLLDVGCGMGFLLGLAKQSGWEPYGLDVSAFAAQYAREHFDVPVHQGALENNTYPPDFFDAVICSHALKHVPSPRTTLLHIHNVLRPGGVLVILTPTPFSSLSYKLFGKLHGPGPPIHLFFFSPRSLSMLLRRLGFQVLEQAVNTHLAYVLSGFTQNKELETKVERVSEEVLSTDPVTFRQRFRNAAIRTVKGAANAIGSFAGVSDEVTIFARKRRV